MARKRQPAWEAEQQKIQDRLRQLWYKLAPNTQSPGGANPNPNPGLGVGPNPLPGAGINPSGMSIPLAGADMGDRASALVREWARGAENIPSGRPMIGMMSGDAEWFEQAKKYYEALKKRKKGPGSAPAGE